MANAQIFIVNFNSIPLDDLLPLGNSFPTDKTPFDRRQKSSAENKRKRGKMRGVSKKTPRQAGGGVGAAGISDQAHFDGRSTEVLFPQHISWQSIA